MKNRQDDYRVVRLANGEAERGDRESAAPRAGYRAVIRMRVAEPRPAPDTENRRGTTR